MKKSTAPSPLFIPLRREFFDMFREGTKVAELRKHGPRWNETTCWVGRDVVLSCGYGKARRLAGIIARVTVVDIEQLATGDRQQILQCCGFSPRVIVITIGNLRPLPARGDFQVVDSTEQLRRYIVRKYSITDPVRVVEFDGAVNGLFRVRIQAVNPGAVPMDYYLTPKERKVAYAQPQ